MNEQEDQDLLGLEVERNNTVVAEVEQSVAVTESTDLIDFGDVPDDEDGKPNNNDDDIEAPDFDAFIE